MKTRVLLLITTLFLNTLVYNLKAQSIEVSAELKELISLSLAKDRKIADKNIDKQMAEEQQKAVKAAYIPKLELGGKYLYGYSSVNSDISEIKGFESIGKLGELMNNPAFPVLFPSLAGITKEITQLQNLMAQQGLSFPALTDNLNGDFSGNYYGIDATLKMLLYSGGQVPNISKALAEKIKVQDALTDKCEADVISEVITCYDQLAMLGQYKKILDESGVRLSAETKLSASALKNGMATAFDTLKIAVAKANLEAKLSEYESRRLLLNQKLSQLTGKDVTGFDYMMPDLEIMYYSNSTPDLNNRPELRALTAGAEAQKYMLKSEKSHYLPKIQAIASVRYDNLFKASADFNGPLPMNMTINNIGLGPTYLIGAGFKWEIFDRSGGSARVHQAVLEVRKAENTREEARELLIVNQAKSSTNYSAALSQVAFKNKQRTAARMALDLAQKSYDAGMINITERLVSEYELQNAELEFLQSVYNERQSVLEYYKATGDLTLSNIR